MWLRTAITVGVVSLGAFAVVSGIAQTKPADDPTSVLNASARTKVAWNFAKAKTADVTCDGKPDRILFGVSKEGIWMGVLPGGGGQPQVIGFTYGAFCAQPKHITFHPHDCKSDSAKLDDCKPLKGCKDFAIDDEECDPLNFYWDARHRRFNLWRN